MGIESAFYMDCGEVYLYIFSIDEILGLFREVVGLHYVSTFPNYQSHSRRWMFRRVRHFPYAAFDVPAYGKTLYRV